jgi:uncharacterized protein YjbI with pentapeptide repeats
MKTHPTSVLAKLIAAIGVPVLANAAGSSRSLLSNPTETSANLRHADLRKADLQNANLQDADLFGADLAQVDLAGAHLGKADLRNTDLRGIKWQEIAEIKLANVYGVKNAPPGFWSGRQERAQFRSKPMLAGSLDSTWIDRCSLFLNSKLNPGSKSTGWTCHEGRRV